MEAITGAMFLFIVLVLVILAVMVFQRLSLLGKDMQAMKGFLGLDSRTEGFRDGERGYGISLFQLREFSTMDRELRKALIRNISDGVLAKGFGAMTRALNENRRVKDQMLLDLRKMNESIPQEAIYQELSASIQKEAALSPFVSGTAPVGTFPPPPATLNLAPVPGQGPNPVLFQPIALKEGFLDYQRLSSDLLQRAKARIPARA